MKFQHLPVGARFEYCGAIYTKTGPIAATSEQGGQRMIPRHAELRSLDSPAIEDSVRPDRLVAEARVLEAFAAFCKECGEILDENTQAGFEAAKQRFMESLAATEMTGAKAYVDRR